MASGASPDRPPGPPVVVEVLVFRLDDDSLLAYREVTARWRPPDTPDTLALTTAGIAGPTPQSIVCHSTSWRCDAGGDIVLTYAVAPDPDPEQPAVALPPVGILCSGDPLRPTPPGLHTHHVATHAVRHLSQLAEHDPAVRAAACCHTELWRTIAELAATMTVGAHEQIHA